MACGNFQKNLIGERAERLKLIRPERDVHAEHRRRRLAAPDDPQELRRRELGRREVHSRAGRLVVGAEPRGEIDHRGRCTGPFAHATGRSPPAPADAGKHELQRLVPGVAAIGDDAGRRVNEDLARRLAG